MSPNRQLDKFSSPPSPFHQLQNQCVFMWLNKTRATQYLSKIKPQSHSTLEFGIIKNPSEDVKNWSSQGCPRVAIDRPNVAKAFWADSFGIKLKLILKPFTLCLIGLAIVSVSNTHPILDIISGLFFAFFIKRWKGC